MSLPFTPDEWQILSGELRLREVSQRDKKRSLPAAELSDETTCRLLLDRLTPVIGSPDRAITASLLSKRLAFLATGACLYAMSAYNKGLVLSAENTLIEYGHDGGLWTSCIPLRDIQPVPAPEGVREAWRQNITGTLFAGLLAPLWQTFSRVSGISSHILWENTAVRVYSLYERRMAKMACPSLKSRIRQDFDWLLNEADADLFGLPENPLRRFRRPLSVRAGEQVRFRRTCCFYYKASSPVEYCSTCPLLRPRKNP
ncbi:siderophore-iron reductase, Fe-S cluster protein [Klebsiella pneumoniae]|nr:siderophore-iron reductase, Fe-S cluster protein [Klebsiella pneumoniae]